MFKANGVHLEYRSVIEFLFGIECLDRGVYGLPGNPGCVVAATRIGHGVICLESALYLHGVLEDEPWESWLCIGHKAWKPMGSRVFPVEIVRTKVRFTEAELVRRPDGLVYSSLPRTLVDFHRYRHRFLPGRPAEVLQKALGLGKTTLAEVAATAARLGLRWP